MASRPWLAWKRYAEARGNVLAAGVGYFAFFSIFPATALAFTVFGFVLRGQPELLSSIVSQLSAYLPGLVRDAQHPEGLIAIQAPQAVALTITGVFAFIALVLAGLGWLGATRDGVRAIFGASGSAGNIITNKVRDVGVLFTLGLGVVFFAVLTSVVGGAAGWIAERIGLSGHGWIFVLAGFAVSVPADTGLMMVLLRVVSGVSAPWRNLFQGALVGGVGFSVLKISAAALLSSVTSNPLFASFAIVVGLLFWLNLVARLTLISAAWAANDVEAAGAGQEVSEPAAPSGSTAVARDPSLPTLAGRPGDRTTLASGFVLGVSALAATRVLTRGLRSIVRIARG